MAGYPNNPNDFGQQGLGSLEGLIAGLRQGNNRSASGHHGQHGFQSPHQAPGSSFLTQIASQQLAPQQNPFYIQNQQQQQQQQHVQHVQHPMHGYHHPSVSSPVPTPQLYNNQPPHHGSAIMSPVDSPQPRPQQIPIGQTSRNLLDLLKHNTSESRPVTTSTPPAMLQQPQIVRRDEATNALLATLLGGNTQQDHRRSASFASNHSQGEQRLVSQQQTPFQRADIPASTAPPAQSTQDYLLGLLNAKKPAPAEATPVITPVAVTRQVSENIPPPAAEPKETAKTKLPQVTSPTETASSKIEHAVSSAEKSFEAPKSKPLFTYKNPFEELASESPRRSPAPSAAGLSLTKGPIQILKPQRSVPAAENTGAKREDGNKSSRSVESSLKNTPPSSSGQSALESLLGIGKPSSVTASKSDEQPATGKVQVVAEEDGDKAVNDLVASLQKQELADGTASDENTPFKAPDNEGASAAVTKTEEPKSQEAVLESWENAETETVASADEKKDDGPNIKIYNFPMKPWISITVKADQDIERPQFDLESTMPIAKLKKAFDQNDRTLVTASNTFIVFAMSKNGGIRLVRQDTGRDKKIFDETRDQIFNVAASTTTTDGAETVIGTGCSGTVYWAAVREPEGEIIESFNSKNSFALPPIQSPGDENPGGVLKTRARKSSSHPEFFAVGRGKCIHIIWPYAITQGDFVKPGPDSIVDVDKYLAHRTLKIDTGKAAKDFTFSQDDTVVVSLDKAGRVKFWDARPLTTENQPANQSLEIKDPLMTLVTTAPTEKSWPTSVLFVDKVRPYLKGGALRYLIVGMKQNHTLQLWDLALGKPVQELHLPHDKESDAACSVVYHAASGVLVVGHPTRNSIYFIHLSAPKYNLPKSMTQAEFIEKLAMKDATLQQPESTAVLSGIREYAFSDIVEKDEAGKATTSGRTQDKRTRGDLRSLDILQHPSSLNIDKDDPALFELYTMHSTGVTCISVKQDTLGWDSSNRAIHPFSAVDEGLITVADLKPIELGPNRDNATDSPASSKAAPVSTPKSVLSKDPRKSTAAAEPSSASSQTSKRSEQPQTPANGTQDSVSGAERVEKRKKKKAAAAKPDPSLSADYPPVKPEPTPVAATNGSAPVPTVGLSSDNLDKVMKSVQGDMSTLLSTSVTASVEKSMEQSLDKLYQRFTADKMEMAAVSDEKQAGLLRLVSKTLSENVDQTLGSIVELNIKQHVLPSVSDLLSKTVAKGINDSLTSRLGNLVQGAVQKEVQNNLPSAVGKALDRPEFTRTLSKNMTDTMSQSIKESLTQSISASIVRDVSFKVESQFSAVMTETILPSFAALAKKAVEKSIQEVERHGAERIAQLEQARQQDSQKIEQLSGLVTKLTETISTMAAAQQSFQAQVLRMTQDDRSRGQTESVGPSVEPPSSPAQSRQNSAVGPHNERERALANQNDLANIYETALSQIADLMHDGNFPQAMMIWLSVGREQPPDGQEIMQDIFDNYFSKYDAGFMAQVPPILMLSVAATLTEKFEGHTLLARIKWLETILRIYQAIPLKEIDPDVRRATPNIMVRLRERFENLLMRVSQGSAQDPLLRRIQSMALAVNRIHDSCLVEKW